MFRLKQFIAFILIISVFQCKEESEKIALSDDYKTSFNTYWKEKDESRIHYLQLAGLFKLDSLDNTFGKNAENDLVLNISTIPGQIGTFSVLKDGVHFKSNSDTVVKTESDSIITNSPLDLDEYGSSILLYQNQLHWQVITRSGQQYVRVWDSENPAVDAFKGFKKFEMNPNLIFNGNFSYYTKAKEEFVKAEVDGKRNISFIGKVTFDYLGTSHSLEVGGDGFTMVGDDTSGDETYGGGRYIYLELPQADGTVTIDFNLLYNPPCAFNEFTTCLYPPRQNYLDFKVEAGELLVANQ